MSRALSAMSRGCTRCSKFKALGGPSFGNNSNNRAEEAIGNAVDFWTAYREGLFGHPVPRPFLGYVMLVEDMPGSRSVVRVNSSRFPVLPEFEECSYIERAARLCERLVAERLYDSTCVLASPPAGEGIEPNCWEPEPAVGAQQFLESLVRRVGPLAPG